ncbi:haloacid dehalogenase-like hydrolase [Xylariaceae sp. FL0016]|nr:haloacid dehalogenase-like hydrolase [Xylariaceae sp. FL0016]
MLLHSSTPMRRFISSSAAHLMSKTMPRRFAPLKGGTIGKSDLPELRGVIFDVDGTLCEPQNHMFGQMREVLGISKSVDILEHIYSLPTPEDRERAMEHVRNIERKSMAEQVAQPGLVQLMDYLDKHNIPKGICTRNFEQPVQHLLSKFLANTSFEPIVTRDFRPPKPDPAGLLFIARSWGLVRRLAPSGEARNNSHPTTGTLLQGAQASKPGELLGALDGGEVGDGSSLIMVGDSIDDMTAGRRAGAATVLLVNDANRHLADHEHTDLVIERLDDLVEVLDQGFIGRR